MHSGCRLSPWLTQTTTRLPEYIAADTTQPQAVLLTESDVDGPPTGNDTNLRRQHLTSTATDNRYRANGEALGQRALRAGHMREQLPHPCRQFVMLCVARAYSVSSVCNNHSETFAGIGRFWQKVTGELEHPLGRTNLIQMDVFAEVSILADRCESELRVSYSRTGVR
ncbi:hypothetical protein NDU88_002916 [Pleurodeles waltl]|uniref:Uncharacterized protein n=1 Tax=Pleurodeles waltl TaxID=8319 RepID=A0AAV7W5E5_PLEWA|nr:hypothetical protein NDU88_002916 [Pleurodeles waltl]